MKYLILLLFTSLSCFSATYESFDLPLRVAHNINQSAPVSFDKDSVVKFKLANVSEVNFTASIDGMDYIGKNGDIISFSANKDFATADSMHLFFAGEITGNVSFGLAEIQYADGTSMPFDLFRTELRGVDTLTVNTSEGAVSLNSKADHFSNKEKTIDLTFSDRSNQVRHGDYNDVWRFDKLSDKFDYVSKVTKATVNGVAVDVVGGAIYDNSEDYFKYSVDYVYSVNSNGWRSVFKINNENTSSVSLNVVVKLTPITGGQHKYDVHSFEYETLLSESALNVTLTDILNYNSIDTTQDYHAKITFYSTGEVSMSSQNATPNGRTVNIIK